MEKRRHPRRPVTLDVELTYPGGETVRVTTRDISESGMFLILDPSHMPTIGEVVGVHLVGDSVDQEHLPGTDAVVVRHTPDGIGLAFIEMDFFDDE
ncbi:MAG: PilZ domain-containing protein [Gammaproteobacteria bacterium]|nr:MAG: PilZ domain-containing protein [Gammaproteobacteria bacterium]